MKNEERRMQNRDHRAGASRAEPWRMLRFVEVCYVLLCVFGKKNGAGTSWDILGHFGTGFWEKKLGLGRTPRVESLDRNTWEVRGDHTGSNRGEGVSQGAGPVTS
jgi:hypothetical protein